LKLQGHTILLAIVCVLLFHAIPFHLFVSAIIKKKDKNAKKHKRNTQTHIHKKT